MVSLLADPSGPPDEPAPTDASGVYRPVMHAARPAPEPAARPTLRPKQAPGPAALRRDPEPAVRRDPEPPVLRRDPEPAASLASAVQLLARGAGLDAASIPAERHAMVLGVAGQLLREMALGLSAALKARAETRPDAPAAADSPLESGGSVEAVLGRLLGPVRTNAPLAVELVREGLAGLRHHELATHAALRIALDEYVKRFTPANLQAQFDQAQQRAATAPDKQRYWELYADMFRVLSQSNAQGLPHAFAEAFARAYAAQGTTPAAPTAGSRSERGSS